MTSKQSQLLLSKFNAHNLKPSLIVIDTLARCFVGGDENSAQDMGRLVQAITYLKRETGAAVLLLHHCGKPGDGYSRKLSERGSSALRGAAESMIRLERVKKEHQIELVNEKQRDAAEFSPITLWLKPVTVMGMADHTGEPVTSCVVSEMSDYDDVSPKATLGVQAQTGLNVLAGFPDGVASSTEWQTQLGRRLGKPAPDRTFHNWRKKLIAERAIEAVPDRPHQYRVAANVRSDIKANMKGATITATLPVLPVPPPL